MNMLVDSHFTFAEYQLATAKTAIYPEVGTGSRTAVGYCTLKLNGEAGEVAEKIAKAMYRLDPQNEPLPEVVKKELGDILWYISQIASEFHLDLGDIALTNLAKLADRQARGVLKGSGDNR